MHLNFLPPAMLLITAAISTPVQLAPAANHILAARQLDVLGPLLKGIMSQNQGSPPAPAVAPPAAPIPTPVPNEDCSEAIQKIDEALVTSERFMSASGTQPTIRDIQAVLAILADSLGEDCKEMNPLGDFPGTSKSAAVTPRAMKKCSDCERQLYSIVKGLEQILSMTQYGKGEAEVSSLVGSALSATPTMLTTTLMVTTTSLGLPVTTPALRLPPVTDRA